MRKMEDNKFAFCLGKNISNRRKASEMNQEQLAEKVGISVRQLGNLESGTCIPSSLVLYKIAKVLNTSMDLLTVSPESAKQLLPDEMIRVLNCQDKSSITSFLKLLCAYLDSFMM